jgi:hypothetical protein
MIERDLIEQLLQNMEEALANHREIRRPRCDPRQFRGKDQRHARTAERVEPL